MNVQPVGLAPASAPAGQMPVRIAVWDSTGTRRLAARGRWPLINVEGGAHAQPALLVDAVRRQFGLEVALLRVAAADLVEVECLPSSGTLPRGCSWRPCVLSSLSERSAWERPGWVTETIAAADRELARAGLRRMGPPVQVRHTSVTGLLRIPTDRHPVWLKAVPPLFAHEAAVVQLLAGIAEHEVPRVLAATAGWWLAAEFPAPASSPAGDPLVSVARTQIAAAPRVDEFRALGCPERPLASLAVEASRLAERSDLLGRDDRRRLCRALPQLAGVCAELDSLGFPATIVHGDVSPGNVRWTRKGWLVYDWTDACIAHPFVELASPLSYEGDEEVAASRARAFAFVWAGVMPSRSVERALKLSPVVGAAHQAVSYRSIVDAIDRTAGDQASGERLVVFVRYWVRRLLASLGR